MSPILELAIRKICIEAISALGSSYKEMSCFVKNWGAPAVKAESEEKKAA